VIDITMPDLNGVEATRQIMAENPDAKIIALSMHSERQFVVKMLEAGAVGYLLKDCAFQELIQAIRSVGTGETYLGRKVATIIVHDMADRLMSKKPPSMARLTPRESEVLQLITEGRSTKQIGYGLHVSAKTIETHRRNIMSKLDMNTVAELTKYAIREGITSLGV
jgi:DNA-binding NarL/FixJ family response regulator